jgi:hypothetical protein
VISLVGSHTRSTCLRNSSVKSKKGDTLSLSANDASTLEGNAAASSPAALKANTASEEASTSSTPAAPSHILDPSLFAASFSKRKASPSLKTTNASGKGKVIELAAGAIPKKKRFGMAKGQDGQPMKRLKDGKTIVRVLEKDQREAKGGMEETLAPPPPIAPSQVLPNAKIRAFKKQRLGLKGTANGTKDKVSTPKSLRTEEDPLGLEDPAFLKGGEFAGLGLPAKRKRPTKPSIRPVGGRTKCEYCRSVCRIQRRYSHHPSLLFNIYSLSCHVKTRTSAQFCSIIVKLHSIVFLGLPINTTGSIQFSIEET